MGRAGVRGAAALTALLVFAAGAAPAPAAGRSPVDRAFEALIHSTGSRAARAGATGARRLHRGGRTCAALARLEATVRPRLRGRAPHALDRVERRLAGARRARRCAVVGRRFRTGRGRRGQGPYLGDGSGARPLEDGPEQDEGGPMPLGPYRAPGPLDEPFPIADDQQLAHAAGPADPIGVALNRDIGGDIPDPGSGWETNVATGGGVVWFSGNTGAAYSLDGGATFTYLDRWQVFPKVDGAAYCCDTAVQYVSQIDRFVWVVQYGRNAAQENVYKIASASPAEIRADPRRAWRRWTLPSRKLASAGAWLDFPKLAVGADHVYLTAAAIGTKSYVFVRMPQRELARSGSLSTVTFRVTGDRYPTPVQNMGDEGLAAVTLKSSSVRIFSVAPASSVLLMHDTPIPTIPGEDFESLTPADVDWLQFTGRVANTNVQGAARTGGELWLAWAAGRRDERGRRVGQPHIEVAVIDAKRYTRKRLLTFADPNYAYAYPDLATNARGEVGLSFAWGGGKKWYPGHAVAVISGTPAGVATATGGLSGTRFGDYLSVRPQYPNSRLFAASGFVQVPDATSPYGSKNRPHVVVYGRRADLPVAAVAGAPAPELSVEALSRTGFTVRNRGTAATGPFTVTVSGPGGEPRAFDLPALGAKASASRTFVCVPGTRVASADAYERVGEPDETDNEARVTAASC